MEDSQILALFWQRSQQALAETARKYGPLCLRIARNILPVREDAEECVSDAYQRAWENIPPQRPRHLSAWLGRVVRNLAVNRYQKEHAQKRGGMKLLLSELEECVPSPQSIETQLQEKELTEFLNCWLKGLPQKDRVLFVRRYWYGLPLQELAAGQNAHALAQRMYRLRQSLKAALEKEGYSL